MKARRLFAAAILIVLMVSLTGCVPGDGTNTPQQPAGFFWGIWHGWLAPISLLVGFFTRHIRIYETNNIGWWYDLGFYIAIISGFGGISLTRRNKSNRDK